MTKRFAVIGAGAGGLCAAKHLIDAGIDVTLFEIGAHVGGLWLYGNDNGRSSAYRSLHINSEARVSSFRDFPFPPDEPFYPDHARMKRYFEEYAARFDLTRRIRFNSRVVNVEQRAGGLAVRLENGAEEVPGLYFVGLFDVSGGSNIRMMDDQSAYVAEIASGKLQLPDSAAMQQAIAEDHAFAAKQFPNSPRYGLELDPWRYRKLLAAAYARHRVTAPPPAQPVLEKAEAA